MSAVRSRLGTPFVVALVPIVLALAMPGLSMAQPADDWQPTSSFEGKFDWVQMKSGEWVKGEILVMYDDRLEFDSDEFDDLLLDWDDIQQIRSSQIMNVGFVDHTTAVGVLFLDGDTVTIIGEDKVTEVTRDDVLSITAGEPKEINFWSMKVFAGLIVRSGNSDVREINLQGNFKRRTVDNRVSIDFVGNQNTTEGIEVSNNQRANVGWDRFITKRFFVKPVFAEYYRDPFQNIAARWTLGVGAGYQLIDSPKVDWEVSGGPAYQQSEFSDVLPPDPDEESTPALVVGTEASWDITKSVEFDGTYRFQIVNEESGSYNHHLLISFETELTGLIDFDISWIWDRIQDPRPDSLGITPEKDDFRTTVGLTFDF
jgi:putative salt-induced outer membrane protein YdiY